MAPEVEVSGSCCQAETTYEATAHRSDQQWDQHCPASSNSSTREPPGMSSLVHFHPRVYLSLSLQSELPLIHMCSVTFIYLFPDQIGLLILEAMSGRQTRK